MQQLELFNLDDYKVEHKPEPEKWRKAVYDNYDDWVSHFSFNPKTTDECWTPQDVYETVVEYVRTIYDMTDKVVIRPFYPGGDYENTEYPDNGVVIDNPPFSILSSILKFYATRNIKYFLFCPALTARFYDFTTVIVIKQNITFDNGANVSCAFTTNLLDNVAAMASYKLSAMIDECPSQSTKANLPVYEYPEEVCRVAELQTIAKRGRADEEDFVIYKDESYEMQKLKALNDLGREYFGSFLLLAREKAKEKTDAKTEARNVTYLQLSPSEKAIVDELDRARARAEAEAKNVTFLQLSPSESAIVDELDRAYTKKHRSDGQNT